MTDFVREHTIDTIFSSTFKIYRANLVPLVLLYLIPVVPFYALAAAGVAAGQPELAGAGAVLALLATVFVGGVAILMVVAICNGSPVTLGQAVGRFVSLIPRYVVVYFLYVVVVVIGTILLVIPGIIAAIYLVFSLIVALVEDTGGVAALKRSAELMKGFFWRNLGILLLVGIGVGIVTGIVGGILGFILAIVGFDAEGFVINFVGNVIGAIFAPLFVIPGVLLYLDMRVRKEGLAAGGTVT